MNGIARARALCLVGLGLGVAAGSGCAGSVTNMRPVAMVNTTPAPNESVIVFMRPSGTAFGIQSAVFEAPDGQPARLVGIVAAKKKVAYRTTPGDHMFMVIGESADFMQARLEPGKVYYALVTPRMGVWKARFSLAPVHVANRFDLPGWQAGTAWVEMDQSSGQWAAENAADVERKRAKYLAEWLGKAPFDRPVLAPEDGQ
jgi:hypothetical protein